MLTPNRWMIASRHDLPLDCAPGPPHIRCRGFRQAQIWRRTRPAHRRMVREPLILTPGPTNNGCCAQKEHAELSVASEVHSDAVDSAWGTASESASRTL